MSQEFENQHEVEPVITHKSRSDERRGGVLGIGLALLLATATFFSGMHLGSVSADTSESGQTAGLFSLFAAQPSAEPTDEAIDLSEFWRVWNILEQKFTSASTTRVITTEERIEGAIEGLVDSYDDPYTSYLPPTEASFFEEDISGNFSGVGMEVGIRDDMITIISPLPNTPAEEAGLLAGDVIVRIDDASTEDMGIDEAVRLIRGEEGTVVELTIFREGEIDFLEIPVTRAQIDIPTIDTEQRDNIFIITLYNFNAVSEMRMQMALREYVESDADRLILDLRGNPGGFLQSAVAISSYFLPTGKVIVRESFGEGDPEEVYRSTGRTLRSYAPEEIVILIDRGSASASEIVAGALSEHDVATLIGETTFGKGSVQELIELPSGASVKVTIARWLTPEGTSISAGGLVPDIEVERTPQQRLDGEDPQLDAAIEFLERGNVRMETEE